MCEDCGILAPSFGHRTLPGPKRRWCSACAAAHAGAVPSGKLPKKGFAELSDGGGIQGAAADAWIGGRDYEQQQLLLQGDNNISEADREQPGRGAAAGPGLFTVGLHWMEAGGRACAAAGCGQRLDGLGTGGGRYADNEGLAHVRLSRLAGGGGATTELAWCLGCAPRATLAEAAAMHGGVEQIAGLPKLGETTQPQLQKQVRAAAVAVLRGAEAAVGAVERERLGAALQVGCCCCCWCWWCCCWCCCSCCSCCCCCCCLLLLLLAAAAAAAAARSACGAADVRCMCAGAAGAGGAGAGRGALPRDQLQAVRPAGPRGEALPAL